MEYSVSGEFALYEEQREALEDGFRTALEYVLEVNRGWAREDVRALVDAVMAE